MYGEASWLTLFVVIVGGLGVLALVYLVQMRRSQRRVKAEILCPKSGKHVRVTLLQDGLSGRWIEVVRCAEFAPSDRVICERQCIANDRMSAHAA